MINVGQVKQCLNRDRSEKMDLKKDNNNNKGSKMLDKYQKHFNPSTSTCPLAFCTSIIKKYIRSLFPWTKSQTVRPSWTNCKSNANTSNLEKKKNKKKTQII